MYRRNIQKSAALLITLCLLSAPAGCAARGEEPLSDTQFLLNTVVTVSLYDKKEEAVLQGAFDLCRRYENLFSKTLSGSDIDRVNRAQGQPVSVEAETAGLIEQGLHYHELSKGAFDITAGSLTGLWDFTSGTDVVPSPEEIQAALAHVGRGEAKVEKGEKGAFVTVAEGVRIDLGGIAKGYIGDRMAEYLKGQGVTRAIVNLGGNLSLIGEKEEGKPFTVGIRDPLGEQGDLIASVKGADLSIVSSGSYERSFIKDGVLYHHILDVNTGYPSKSDLAGVTILCKEGTRADAMSTICFLLGMEEGMKLAKEQEGLEAVFVARDGRVETTPGLTGKIELRNSKEETK